MAGPQHKQPLELTANGGINAALRTAAQIRINADLHTAYNDTTVTTAKQLREAKTTYYSLLTEIKRQSSAKGFRRFQEDFEARRAKQTP